MHGVKHTSTKRIFKVFHSISSYERIKGNTPCIKVRLSSTNNTQQHETMYKNGYINLRKYIIINTEEKEGRKDRNSAIVIPQGRHMDASTYTFTKRDRIKRKIR